MIKSSLIFIALLLSTFSFCQITYDTTVFEGQGGFYGMPFSTDFDITDKGSVYYMSSSPNVLSIYNEVDSSPGLSIIKYIKPKFDSIVGFEDAFTMDVSDDEKYLFFGGIGVVHAYKINSNSKKLAYLSSVIRTYSSDSIFYDNSTAWLNLTPDNQYLFTKSIKNFFGMYKFDTISGELSHLFTYQRQNSTIGQKISRDSKFLYTIDSRNIFISLINYEADTLEPEVLQNVYSYSDSIGIIDLAVSPNNNYLAILSNIEIIIYTRNLIDGSLVLHARYPYSFADSFYFRNLEFSRNGEWLYAAGDSVNVYICDTSSGNLTLVERLNTKGYAVPSKKYNRFYQFWEGYVSYGIDTVIGKHVMHDSIANRSGGVHGLNEVDKLSLSPNNKYLYAIGKYYLTVFKRNIETGFLTQLQKIDFLGLSDIKVTPDDRNVIALTDFSHNYNIHNFKVNDDGTLEKIQKIQNYNTGQVEITSDGNIVYVTGGHTLGMSIFNRDSQTGLLSYVDKKSQLVSVHDFIIHDDDRHIYEAADHVHYHYGKRTTGIRVAAKDSNSYTIRGKQLFFKNDSNLSDLDKVENIVLSHDNKFLYVSTRLALMIFSIDSIDKKLSLYKSIKYSSLPLHKGYFSEGLAVTKNDKHIILGRYLGGVLYIFNRDLENDSIYYDSLITNTLTSKADGLSLLKSIDISSDGAFLYTTSLSDDAIGIYKIKRSANDLDLGEDIYKCSTGPVRISVGGGFKSISWSTGEVDKHTIYPTNEGTYSVKVTDFDDSTSTDSISIIYDTLPEMRIISVPHSIENDTITLDKDEQINLSVIDGDYNYAWSLNSFQNEIDIDEDMLYAPYQKVWVTVNSRKGCQASDTVVIKNLEKLYSTSSYLLESVCNSYTSPSGKNTWTYAGYYKDTLTNAMGYDSIIHISLNIKRSTISHLTETVCNQYISPSGKYLWTKSGLYSDTLINAEGCDSIVSIDLSIEKLDNSVDIFDEQITAKEIADSYQWIDCNDNFKEIAGETDRTLNTTEGGEYAVVLSKGVCVDTSSCYVILPLVSNLQIKDCTFKVYPNPSFGSLLIDLPKPMDFNIRIRDVHGVCLFEKEYLNTKEVDLELNEPVGVYYLQIITLKDKGTTLKILKY